MRITYFLFIYITFLILGCQDASNMDNHGSEPTSDTTITIVKDGAWCWFSDPRAICLKGDKDQIILGYMTSGGDVMIGSRNMESGSTTSFKLHDSLEVDDHDVPSIIALPDGHLLAFYNEHNGNVFMRKSVHPRKISQWEEERIIARKDKNFSYTYTNPVRLENESGRIYVFGRKVGPTRSFDHWWPYFKYSDNNGDTWSEDVILLDNEGRVNPPYMKITSDNLSRIDILFTDGHPKIGDDVSVCHMFYSEGQFYQTDGSLIGTTGDLPIPIASVNKVYDASKTHIRSWIWDIALDNQNRPVITYARYPTENDHRYHYAFWDDEKWVDEEICKSGGWMPALRQGDWVREAHYSGGVVLHPGDPRQVYLSREINGKFEIEHMMRSDEGIWSSEFLTSDSQQSQMRPYVVYNSPVDNPFILWMNGDYRHYTDYNTVIKAYYLK